MIKLMKTLKKAWFCTIISAMFVITLSLGIVFGLRNDPISELNDTEIISPKDEDNIENAEDKIAYLEDGSSFLASIKRVMHSHNSAAGGNVIQYIYFTSFTNSDNTTFTAGDRTFIYSTKIIFQEEVTGYYTDYYSLLKKKNFATCSTKKNYKILAWGEEAIYSNFNIYVVADYGYRFQANSDCSGMFKDLSRLYSVNYFDIVDTKNVTYMSSMFSGCSSLTSVSSLSTDNAQDLSSIFSGCTSLKTVPSSFSTSKVTNMSSMFSGCSSLTSVSSLSTDNAQDLSSIFSGCTSLKTVPSSFSTSKVTNMSKMFNNCSSLRTVSSFSDTSLVTNMSHMFSGCYKITTTPSYDTSNVTDMSGMFAYTGISSIPSFNTRNVKNMSYMFSNCTGLTSAVFPDNFVGASVTNLSGMFRGCTGFETIGTSGTNLLNISKFNTSNVEYMSEMFMDCTGLTSAVFPANFVGASVTNLSGMFIGCTGFNTIGISGTNLLNISNFNTSNVEYMSEMFNGCTGLTSAVFPANFVGASVTNLSGMFIGCTGFNTIGISGTNLLNISNFNTSNVEYMSEMFNGCTGLTSAVFPDNFVGSSVKSLEGMFRGCTGFNTIGTSGTNLLNISNFNTSKVTNIKYMFNGCTGITSATLSNFDINNGTEIEGMFNGCSELVTIYANPNKWVKTNGDASTSVFTGCTKLKGPITSFISSYAGANHAVIDMYDGYTPGYLTPSEKVKIQLPTNRNYTYTGSELILKPGNWWSTIYGICNLQERKETNAGTYTGIQVTLKNTTYYTWTDGTITTKTFTATINKRKIELPTAGTTTFTYNGVKQTYLPSNWWYILDGYCEISNNIYTNVNNNYKAKITLKDEANYCWNSDTYKNQSYIEIAWKINPFDISTYSANAVVSDIPAYKYTGSEIKPEPTLKIIMSGAEVILTKNSDYTLSYSNNILPGTATVKLSGTGNYTGDVTKTFEIKETWMNNASSSYAGGTGSETDPYQIATAQQLAKLAVDVNSQTSEPSVYKYYVLTNNINLSGKEWIPIGSGLTNKYFYGSFDGQWYTITGMEIQISTYEDHYFGLFGCVKNSSINEVTLSNVKISMNQVNTDEIYVGCVAGKTEDTDITKIFTNGSVNVVGNGSNTNYVCIGGIVGDATNTTKKIGSCYNEANITTSIVKGFIGGIAGSASGEISECMNFGNITAGTLTSDSRVGGICANVSGNKINNCAVISNITASSGATTYAIANVNCATYYANTNGIKVYQGTFDPNVWFVASGINGGLPMLKSIYWIGAGYTNTSAEITSALTNKGYVVA